MAGPKYVSDFWFPSDAGFTGSAGMTHVKGYARGGSVKKAEPVKKGLGGIIKAISPVAAIASGDAPFGLDKGPGILGGLAGLAMQDALRKKKKPIVAPAVEPVAVEQPTYAKGGKVAPKRNFGKGFAAKPLIGK